jgi:hypothetical protein
MSATLLSNNLYISPPVLRIRKVFLHSFCLFLTVGIIIYSLPVFKDSKLCNLFRRHNTVEFKFFKHIFLLTDWKSLGPIITDPDPD